MSKVYPSLTSVAAVTAPNVSTTATLAALSDVAETTPATNQVLTYNGAKWSNATPGSTGVVLTQLFKNVPAATVTGPGNAWSATYVAQGTGPLRIDTSFTAYTSTTAQYTFNLLIDGVVVDTISQYMFSTTTHASITSMFHINSALSAGSHTIAISIPSGTLTNGSDVCDMTITEYTGPLAATTPPMYLEIRKATSQTVSTAGGTFVVWGTTPTTNTFGSALTMTSGTYNTVTGYYKFSNSSSNTMFWDIAFSIGGTGTSGTDCTASIYHYTGTTQTSYAYCEATMGSNGYYSPSSSAAIIMLPGDYIVINIYSGTNNGFVAGTGSVLTITQIVGGLQGPTGPTANVAPLYGLFTNTSAQSLTATPTLINFPITTINTWAGMLTINAAGNTFTNNTGGVLYLNINYTLIFSGISSGAQLQTYIQKNANTSYGYGQNSINTTLASPAVNGTCVLQLNPNDYITIISYCTSSTYSLYTGCTLELTQIIGGVPGAAGPSGPSYVPVAFRALTNITSSAPAVATGASFLPSTGTTVPIDTNSGYNLTTGAYTAKFAGYYKLDCEIRIGDNNAATTYSAQWSFTISGTSALDPVVFWFAPDNSGYGRRTVTMSTLRYMNVGDIVFPACGTALASGGDVLTVDFTGHTVGGTLSTLAALSDVSVTTPTVGQVLVYNGSKWVNCPGLSINPTTNAVTTTKNIIDDASGNSVFATSVKTPLLTTPSYGSYNGRNMQCGVVPSSTSSITTVTFPWAFSNTPTVVASNYENSGTAGVVVVNVFNVTTTSFQLTVSYTANGSTACVQGGNPCSWIAISPTG